MVERNPFTQEPYVDFFGKQAEPDAAAISKPAERPASAANRRPTLGMLVGTAVLLSGVGMVGFRLTTSETAKSIFHDIDSVMDKDKTITHGSNDPEVAAQRSAIARDRTVDVMAFSLDEAPESSIQTQCDVVEAEYKDSPWSVAQHYAKIYQLGEPKVRALVDELKEATGLQMLEGEEFVICVRPNSNPIGN